MGKTTLARILAKAINCETGDHRRIPAASAARARKSTSGRFVDLLEVDAATNTKVDEMRELLDTAQYMPVSGRFKVYIIDEVHMLSRHAFNSMLKTLEEPPEHVKFILATTDPAAPAGDGAFALPAVQPEAARRPRSSPGTSSTCSRRRASPSRSARSRSSPRPPRGACATA